MVMGLESTMNLNSKPYLENDMDISFDDEEDNADDENNEEIILRERVRFYHPRNHSNRYSSN